MATTTTTTNDEGMTIMLVTPELLEVWEKHHGRLVRVDGMLCKLRVEVRRQVYPYVAEVLDVSAVPTRAARNGSEYRRIRAELGDDWSTDVLKSDVEAQSEILEQLEK